MSEPKRHHLVPRCYLKRFGENKKKDWFVYAHDKLKTGNQIFNVNIKNICVQTEYYTFDKLPEDQKRFLEKFYATNIESDYPNIYEILTDPKKFKLSTKQRISIIIFVISQALRTSKLANNLTQFWNQNLETAYRMQDLEKGITQLHLEGGKIIDFKDKSLEQIKKEEEKELTDYINITNLKRLYEIASRRLKDGIAVKKIHPSFKLITSDNPAYFEKFIYDPNEFIRLPLDEDHLLMIIPHNKDEEYFDPQIISRSNLDEEWSYMDAHYNNIFQIQNCERYIIGRKENIENALLFFKTFNEDDFRIKTATLSKKTQDMYEFVKKYLGK
jgi:Protein of unknown function (DUF4238)